MLFRSVYLLFTKITHFWEALFLVIYFKHPLCCIYFEYSIIYFLIIKRKKVKINFENWRRFKGYYYYYISFVNSEDKECVPPVMEGILSQSDNVHVQVAYTSLQLLGELNEWLAFHPNLLPEVLTFLTKKLQGSPDLSTMAARVSIFLHYYEFIVF